MMRLYIKTITKDADERKPDTYAFTNAIEGAWHWPTHKSADRICCLLSETGIIVKAPNDIGNGIPCTDYRVESRPQGGFTISCEHPFFY